MDHSRGKTSFTGAELLTLHEKHTTEVKVPNNDFTDKWVMRTDWQGMAKDINDYIMGQYAEGYGPLEGFKGGTKSLRKALNRTLEPRRGGR